MIYRYSLSDYTVSIVCIVVVLLIDGNKQTKKGPFGPSLLVAVLVRASTPHEAVDNLFEHNGCAIGTYHKHGTVAANSLVV